MLSTITLLVTSFALGAVHALEPGHGKTIVAAYLVGSRGRWYHAVHLGVVVTITHTLVVIVLGLLAVYGMTQLDAERVQRGLELVTAALIIAVGLWMFWHRLGGHHHHHHHHGHTYAHDPAQTHDAGGADHHHHHVVEPDPRRPSLWSLTALGITGGILPCPAATVPLLYGLNSGRPELGVWAVLAFSLGLAMVLVAVGLAVLAAREWVERRFDRARWLNHVPLFSAGIVTLFGVGLCVKAML